jgi:hypothetical protein
MALFSKDSKKDAPKEEAVKENKKADTKTSKKKDEATSDLSWVIVGPRVTEKAAFISSDNAYTFDVATKANKIQIKKAIEEAYTG